MSVKKLTIETSNGQAKEILENINKGFGMVPNVYGHLANSANVLGGYLSYDSEVKKGTLSSAQIEKISLAVSAFNGCEYCQRAHFAVGKMNKIEKDELRRNLEGESDDAKDHILISLALEILKTKGHLSSSIREEISVLSDEEIVEVFGVVLSTTFTNYFNHVAVTDIDFPEID